MREFRVWAPHAGRVEIDLGGRRLPLEAGEHGWWSVSTEAAHGDDYAFCLDGRDPPLPDPRSAWQPGGVHGPSRVVDHARFKWTDRGWTGIGAPGDLVLYELHTGTFTPEGTFEAAIGKLDHLADLGVNAVELLPVVEFSGSRGWGYDGVDLYAPHHAYGGPAGLKRLVDACHARGLAVILDAVYNHLGPEGNYLERFGPYFTQRYRTPWGKAVNFDDRQSGPVRDFFIENALMWLDEYHCDGLRLDAVHAIFDTSALHFLEELAQRFRKRSHELGRETILIAESDLNDPRLVRAPARGGYGLHAQWSDDFHHSIHALLTGERTGYYGDFGGIWHLAKAIGHAFVYDGLYSEFRQRRHGRSPRGIGGAAFVGCAQNHDQVGNRARGDRLAELVSPGKLRIAAALVLTSPFIPMLFQGEEWGATAPFQFFSDHQDPVLGRAVSEGRAREFAAFGWKPDDVPDPQEPATFERSRLDWAEAGREPHRGLLEWHRELIALRRANPELRDGRFDEAELRFDESEGWLAMRRGRVTLVCNFGPRAVAIPFREGTGWLSLKSDPAASIGDSAVHVPPESVVVIN